MRYLLILLLSSCALDTTPDASDGSVAVTSQALILTPITQKQGTCTAVPGGWCTTQSLVFEGAYYQGSSTYTDYNMHWYNYGPIPGQLPDSGGACAIVRRMNDCNYVRACRWPASDTFTNPNTSGAYVISVKQNAGLAQASQCPGSQGLSTLRYGAMAKLPYSNTQQHSIRVTWPGSGQTLLVQYDGYSTPHSATLPAGVQAWTGVASVYSEKGVYDFQMDGN